MDPKIADIIRKAKAQGLIKDPQWLDKPDEPVPLWVMLEALLELIEKLDPPNRPFD